MRIEVVGIAIIVFLLVFSWQFHPREAPGNWHVIFYPNDQLDIRVVESVVSEEQCIAKAHELAEAINDTFMRVSDYNCGLNPRKLVVGAEPIEPANVIGDYEYELLTR